MKITYRFYIASITIGTLSGLVCVAFRYIIYYIDNLRINFFRKDNLSDLQRIITQELCLRDIFFIFIKYVALMKISM